jgi:hypothetical protein
MPTKYELQAELRELNRGFPRIPISKLKMHELEAHIDAVKKLKTGTAAAMVDKKPVGGGRPGARPIPVEEVEDEDVVIHAPQVPLARITKKPVVMEDEPESLKAPKKKIKVVKEDPTRSQLFPAVKAKSEKVVVCNCNCPSCPKRR